MQGTTTSIVVNTPSKSIYDVVLDFESYPEFLPDVKAVTVQKKGKQILATFEISLIKKIVYTLAFIAVPHKKISWTFIKGDVFKENIGSWEFEEVKKKQTKTTYNIEVNFGFLVPSLITNKLVGHNLPQMMKRFKERAESL